MLGVQGSNNDMQAPLLYSSIWRTTHLSMYGIRRRQNAPCWSVKRRAHLSLLMPHVCLEVFACTGTGLSRQCRGFFVNIRAQTPQYIDTVGPKCVWEYLSCVMTRLMWRRSTVASRWHACSVRDDRLWNRLRNTSREGLILLETVFITANVSKKHDYHSVRDVVQNYCIGKLAQTKWPLDQQQWWWSMSHSTIVSHNGHKKLWNMTCAKPFFRFIIRLSSQSSDLCLSVIFGTHSFSHKHTHTLAQIRTIEPYTTKNSTTGLIA